MRLLTTVLVLLSFFSTPSSAQVSSEFSDSANPIDQAYREGRLTYDQALNDKMAALFHPDRLPADLRPLQPFKSGTLILHEALARRSHLTARNRALLHRPTDPGDPNYDPISNPNDYYGNKVALCSYVSPGGHFRLHYTLDTANATKDNPAGDAVPSTDSDGDHVPDYVEKYAQYLDEAWDRIRDMGFDAAPPDSATGQFLGGDCLLDVYLMDIDAYGLTLYENTPADVYMIVENDYAGFPGNDNPDGFVDGDMKVTAAHELFHTFQWQISTKCDGVPGPDASNCWWMEASAVWMEDAVFPEVKDYLNYLSSWFSTPNLPLNTYNGGYEYGTVVWVKHLSEKYGEGIVREIWETIGTDGVNALDATRNVLSKPGRGSSLAEELREFRAKNGALIYWDTPYHDGADYRGSVEVIYGNDLSETYTTPFVGNCRTSSTVGTCSLGGLSSFYYLFAAPSGRSGTLSISYQGSSLSNGEASVLVIGMTHPYLTVPTSVDRYLVSRLDLSNVSQTGSMTVGDFGALASWKQVMVVLLNPGESSFTGTLTVSFTDGGILSSTASVTPLPQTAVLVPSGHVQLGVQAWDGGGQLILPPDPDWSSASGDGTVDGDGLVTILSGAPDFNGVPITASFTGGGSGAAAVSNSTPSAPSRGADRGCSQWLTETCAGMLGKSTGSAASSNSDKRCFIATAAFGTPLHPYVQVLREFRDRYLLPHAWGRAFVESYYRLSPPLAEVIASHKGLKAAVGTSLIPLVVFASVMVKTSLLEKLILLGVVCWGAAMLGRRYTCRR